MKRILYIIPLLFLLGSCNDWLDVQPEGSVSLEELFSKEEGFQEAINGIYTRASAGELYGGIFTVEILDAMLQNYSFTPNDNTSYVKTANYDFTDNLFKYRTGVIWSTAYNAITNCNLILENIDSRKDIFSPGMYELIKGEALAMRAYLHFDLLRFFSPSYATNPAANAIPYVTTYSNKVTPLATVSQTLDRVIKDLTDAKALMNGHDPIQTAAYVVGYNTDDKKISTELAGNDLFLQNRRHRLNYYAVCGVLARAYLYKGDRTNASANALEVINAVKFPWVDPDDFTTPAIDSKDRDRMMYPELVFCWYIEREAENLSKRYEAGTNGYYIDKGYCDGFYEFGTVGADDYRLRSWFLVGTGSTDAYEITKYRRNYEEVGDKHYLVAPAIRLSEMYYIAAEAAYATNPTEGWNYLNTVRTHRGLRTVLAAPSVFEDELLKEYRKETFAEGQAWFAYKRLNRDIVGQSRRFPAGPAIYVMPLPEDEIEFGNR